MARNVTVEYTKDDEVYYLADFQFTAKSDFTNEKSKAMPMNRGTADLAVERAALNGLTAKVVTLR